LAATAEQEGCWPVVACASGVVDGLISGFHRPVLLIFTDSFGFGELFTCSGRVLIESAAILVVVSVVRRYLTGTLIDLLRWCSVYFPFLLFYLPSNVLRSLTR
jgi:hypothetical protein